MFEKIKTTSLAILLILCFSCSEQHTAKTFKIKKTTDPNIVKSEFQSIIDSANVTGSILIFDAQTDLYYSNYFDWCKKGQLPASTFKIPNSIIALETGVVQNENKLFKWNGEKRAFKIWEQDLSFRDAFHFSCIPCYQEIAREIGADRMKEYLKKLNFGSIKMDATTIDNFWLVGESEISPFQQIEFLKRFHQSELPIAERTEQIMKEMIVIEKNEDYKLSGKTGWSISNEDNNGWFVGYVESGNNVYYFATNIEPQEQLDIDLFPKIRKEITYKALRAMKILE